MAEIIELSRADLAGAEELLNLTFPVAMGSSYFDDFPFWAAGSISKQILLGIGSPARLHAVAMAKLSCAKISDRIHSVAVIGSVATHPEARGKGYATRLVDRLCNLLQAQGIQCVFLFGSEETLYSRLGFSVFGEQVRIPLSALAYTTQSTGSYALHRSYTEAMGKALIQRKTGLLLEEADLGWIARHKNTKWFYVTEQGDQRVIAYAAVGKGIDLGNMVHEWGVASPDHLPALHFLIRKLSEENSKFELLGSRQEILSHGFSSRDAWVEPLGMVKRLQDDAPSLEELSSVWLWGFDGV